ncbi:MAG: phage tail protein [Deltaproteobacteria bacterium]|nr:phage tail protein [Deltaproteobacteria bacterium]
MKTNAKRKTAAWASFALLSATVTIAGAADFSVNATRFDPYKNFKFRVKWDGKYVSGVAKVSGLYRETAVTSIRNVLSGRTTKTPGATTYQPIVIERGRTHDTAFEDWANKVFNLGSTGASPTADYRKDMMIELYNEAGQMAMAWRVKSCWPSKYSPLKEFNANRTEVAVETIVLEHDGWVRDTGVNEPAEPSFTRP